MKSCQAHGRTTPATSPRRKTRRPLFLMSQASGAPEGDSALAGERASASDGACSLHELRLLIFTSPLEACPATKSHFDSTPAVSGFLGPVFSLRFPTQLTLPGSCFCFLLAIGSFLAFFLQHIPNFSFSFPTLLVSCLSAERNRGGKQNRRDGISGSGSGSGLMSKVRKRRDANVCNQSKSQLLLCCVQATNKHRIIAVRAKSLNPNV